MLTFIAFVLTILGCINWLMIGLLQYDFVAGLFGWQSSMMSRLVYIAIGVASIYLVLRVLINKGCVKVWERKNKIASENSSKVVETTIQSKKGKRKFWKKKTPKKVEKVKIETVPNDTPEESPDEPFSEEPKQEQNNLFDEHFEG